MRYDPIKDKLGRFFARLPVLQRLFYRLLDLLFLRSWYVRKELKGFFRSQPDREEIRVLDAGSGFGQYTWFMLRSFPRARVLAVDINDEYLEMSRRFVAGTPYTDRAEFAVDDLTQLRAAGLFDLILSVDVMEHIEEDELVFQNFCRVLAPNGHLIINTPSDEGGSGVRHHGEESFIDEHVRDGYGMLDLTSRLKRAGLSTVKAVYTYGRFGSVAWKLTIKVPMQLLSRTWLSILLLVPYYAITLPIALILNAVDVRAANETGTGLLVVARKKRPRKEGHKLGEVRAALN